MIAHDLAAQSLTDRPLRPFAGTCPECGTNRGWLKSRCPECERPVRREFVAVVVGVVVAAAFAHTIGTRWALIPYLGFVVLSLALLLTDIDDFRIVDRLNIRGTALLSMALALASVADSNFDALWRALLAAAAYFGGTFLMFALVKGRGFGFGDVKLSIQLGLFAGYVSWGTLGYSVFLTALIGGLLALFIVFSNVVSRRRSEETSEGLREDMKRELPYGPAMILGCWLAIILAGLGAFPIPA